MRRFALLVFLGFACDDNKDPIGPKDNDGDGYPSDIDCNDDDASIKPYADETCDGIDNNCDGQIDEGVTQTFYADADEDGFGSDADSVLDCDAPQGYVSTSGDCDDTVANINPDMAEVCDEIDNDCDGQIDDEDDSLDTTGAPSWYPDVDGDGYGDDAAVMQACTAQDMLSTGGDCNDSDANINPDMAEVCDGVDNDCDGDLDVDDDSFDDSLSPTWYYDGDGDNEGDPDNAIVDCIAPEGYVSNATDCNDNSAAFNTQDADGDGITSCDGDCDDTEPSISQCEFCVDENILDIVGVDVFQGSVSGNTDQSSSCGIGPETVMRWVPPSDGDYLFTLTADFDPYISIWDGCDESELSCQAGYSHLDFFNAGVEVLLVVGAVNSGETGNFSISIGSSYEGDCTNGIDEDSDGLTDCADEEDCWYHEACAMSSCPNFDLIDVQTYEPALGDDLFQGSLDMATDDASGSCLTGSGVDYAFYWEAPADGCAIVMAYSDTIDLGLYIWDDCNGTELSCNAESSFASSFFGTTYGTYLEQTVQAGDDYIFVVDAESPTGEYGMSVQVNTYVYCDGTLTGNQ